MSDAKASPSTGKSGKRKFVPGEKVFAKVRGYPSWPARIDAIADEHPSRMKYHVYFYGTGETAVVKGEDVCSFIENKHRLGKPKKLSEALKQALADLTDSEKKLLAQFEDKGGSDMEDSLNSSAAASKPRRSSVQSTGGTRTSTAPTPTNKTAPSISSPAPGQVKRKRQESAAKDTSVVDEKSAGESEQNEANSSHSRTGRVIKPPKKLVSDDGEENASADNTSTRLSGPPGPASKRMRVTEPSSGNDEGDDFIWAKSPDGVKVKIPLKLAPQQFKDLTMAQEWDDEAFNKARELKKDVEDGKLKAADVESRMRGWMTERAKEFEGKRVKCFEIEHDLLQIDFQIKGALALKKADTGRCIELLNQLRPLQVTTLMLKKHPEVVNTVKKIRNYVGNVANWNMSAEDASQFEKDCEVIRGKAGHIYNNFRSLFLSSDTSTSFWAYFSDEITKFEGKTKDLSSEQVFSLVYEP